MKLLYPLAAIVVQCCLFAQPTNQDLQDEHVYGGLPSNGHLLFRTAYVQDWDGTRKAPRWVAYRLIPDYRNLPSRSGRWSTYRSDPDVTNETSSSGFDGMNADPIAEYEAGHLAPFMMAGGDRDNDGLTADGNNDGDFDDPVDDPDDALTIYQVNYRSNLTPQHGDNFNGTAGVWYRIEERVRDLMDVHCEVWVFAGPIWGAGTYDMVNGAIPVAPMFFQIIIWEDPTGTPQFEAYMTPNHQKRHGDIREQMVSIRHIEAMTGLDFFPDLSLGDSERISTY